MRSEWVEWGGEERGMLGGVSRGCIEGVYR